MAGKSKFFRIAVEGATSDGRAIPGEWLTKMAASYNPDKYGARINLEHIRGIDPESIFKRYGDVTALKAEKITGGDLAGKIGLYAQIEPTDELVAFSRKKQKVYTSMEVNPEFADTREPYLVGLAITDSPASLGTEMLQFCAQAQINPLADRKQSPTNIFTAAELAEIELEQLPTPTDPTAGLTETLKALFSRLLPIANTEIPRQTSEQSAAKAPDADFMHLVAQGQIEMLTRIGEFGGALNLVEEMRRQIASIQTDFAALKAALGQAPEFRQQPQRPTATGGNGDEILTDC
ncbi:GPO family capsid scaffolding protein [Silvimonas sp.]|uniref:GPO family capsid scaffolding protein n=1 Tax=Silvimonas sp. TaxID=2650811 RepID=UPI0028405F7C|nr:GPO family capsid scaffolding protein [Silvimonas sp.]MDR3429031.1 GPO family capsid scaffolding protein [Silvimonas sp.]